MCTGRLRIKQLDKPFPLCAGLTWRKSCTRGAKLKVLLRSDSSICSGKTSATDRSVFGLTITNQHFTLRIGHGRWSWHSFPSSEPATESVVAAALLVTSQTPT